MKKSTPTPASAILLAVFFHAASSVVYNLRSPSVPCRLLSSRCSDSFPGPHVGRLASAQTILPPVGCSAERAAFKVGSNADSVFLICEKMVGIRARRDEMTDLVCGQ